jgi:pimeloyl-ACP methyl ester carboxylesterase
MRELALNYRSEGSGPALLLVHGFGISFKIWQNLLPLLSPHFTLVMVELPGIGGSAIPEPGRAYLEAVADGIEAVRLSAGLSRWDVLGYSSGSRAAEAYIRKYPQGVGRALFLCPLHVGAGKALALRACLGLDRRLPGFGDRVLRGANLRFLISLLGFNLRRDPHAEEWYVEISRAPLPVLKETIRSLPDFAGRPFEVPVSAAFIWGDVDLVPRRPRHPDGWNRFIHATHAAPVLNAAEVAEAIRAVLEA